MFFLTYFPVFTFDKLLEVLLEGNHIQNVDENISTNISLYFSYYIFIKKITPNVTLTMTPDPRPPTDNENQHLQTNLPNQSLDFDFRNFFTSFLSCFDGFFCIFFFYFLGGADTSLYLHEVNDKVDQFVSEHDLCVEVGDQEADVITLI